MVWTLAVTVALLWSIGMLSASPSGELLQLALTGVLLATMLRVMVQGRPALT